MVELPTVRFRDVRGVPRLVLRMDGRCAMAGLLLREVAGIWVYPLFSEEDRPRFENPAPFTRVDVESLAAAADRARAGGSGRLGIAAGPEPGLTIELSARFAAFTVSVTLFRGEPLTFEAGELPSRDEILGLWPPHAETCPSCGLDVAVPLGDRAERVALDASGQVVLCPTCRFVLITSGAGKKVHVVHEQLASAMAALPSNAGG